VAASDESGLCQSAVHQLEIAALNTIWTSGSAGGPQGGLDGTLRHENTVQVYDMPVEYHREWLGLAMGNGTNRLVSAIPSLRKISYRILVNGCDKLRSLVPDSRLVTVILYRPEDVQEGLS